MPWKQGYTISDEVGLRDAEIRWPDGNRCCMTVVVDLSVARGPEGICAADLMHPDAYFAAHDGLDQVLAVLRRFGIKATFAAPAVIAQLRAERLRALMAEGHEIAGNGLKHEDVSALDAAEEKARLDLATEILTRTIGHRPTGWFCLPRQDDPFAGGTISPHTIDLLIDAGYQYMGNGLADDVPHYWVTDFAARRAILTLPYYYHFDDQWFLSFPRKGTGLDTPMICSATGGQSSLRSPGAGGSSAWCCIPARSGGATGFRCWRISSPMSGAFQACGIRPAVTARGTGRRRIPPTEP